MEIDFCDIDEVDASRGDVFQIVDQHYKSGRPLVSLCFLKYLLIENYATRGDEFRALDQRY